MGEHPEPTLCDRAVERFGAVNSAEKKLFDLAQERFKELSDSEYELFRAIANGEPIDYRTGNEADDKPENAANWGAKRILRGDRLRWLCTEPEVWKLCLPQGIDVSGAKIESSLNLSFSEVNVPLRFFQCYFAKALRLRQAKLTRLDLRGTHVASEDRHDLTDLSEPFSIDAREMRAVGSVLLHLGFRAQGKVSLLSASIGGNLGCSKGSFQALDASGLNVNGAVLLREGLFACGKVNFYSATIGVDFDCRSGIFTNPKGNALNADQVNVRGNVFLSEGFQAEGTVSLGSATIEGSLYCNEGRFSSTEGRAFNAFGINVRGDVFLSEGFQARGEVSLVSATIAGSLYCLDGKFTTPEGKALFAQNINVKGNVFLQGEFQAEGLVDLYSAMIEGESDCSGGKFTSAVEDNEVITAIKAESVSVKGSIFLRQGFQAEGSVNLFGTTVGGDLDCSGATLISRNGDALIAQSLNVKGDVLLNDGFQSRGMVTLLNSQVGSTLTIAKVKAPTDMSLVLEFAKIQTLNHAEDSFPAKGKLRLNGLVYKALGEKFPKEWKDQLQWLQLQWLQLHPKSEFFFQPYEQLAKVLHSTGYSDEAIQILVGKEDDELTYGKLPWLSKVWKRFLGITLAYGYRPGRALLLALFVVVLGSFLFYGGYQQGLITPTDKDCKFSNPQQVDKDCPNQPQFNPFIYSLDVFLPIIDLRLKNSWIPNATKGNEFLEIKSGAWLRYYLWLHILLGWALTTLWVAGFTGLVRSTNK